MQNAKPLREHSYIVTVPTFTFEIQGKPIRSATEIRNMIAKADDEKLVAILRDLYGRQDIPDEVTEIFKRKLGSQTMSESWLDEDSFEMLLEANLHYELLEEKDEDIEAFDPKTMDALRDLKVKYPQADNIMGALVADIEDSQKRSKQNDAEHDIQIADLEKKIAELTKELRQLKTTKESQMKITDIISEEITLGDTQDFHEEFAFQHFQKTKWICLRQNTKGRKVKLNKPMRGM